MEFVDYKCLESLLIEGKDLIATEWNGFITEEVLVNFFNK